MKILIACEFSGRVRDAFINQGHDVTSCDFLATESPGPHYMGPVEDIIEQDWDMMIAHPPCTFLCASGLWANKNNAARQKKTDLALAFVELLWSQKISKICIENPVGCINTRLRYMPKPQYIQPYEFGEDASKKTGLWLKGLPKLKPTKHIEPRIYEYCGRKYNRWGNQDDSGRDNTPNTPKRGHLRSVTYQGIALAMASQWG